MGVPASSSMSDKVQGKTVPQASRFQGFPLPSHCFAAPASPAPKQRRSRSQGLQNPLSVHRNLLYRPDRLLPVCVQKARRIGTMGNFEQFFLPFRQHGKVFRIPQIGINGLAINAHHCCDIMDTLHATFNFETFYAAFDEVRQMIQETKVL